MNTDKHIKVGRNTAVISFLIGTIIFVLYYLTLNFGIVLIGFCFVVLAGLINLGIFLSILRKYLKDLINRKRLFNTLNLMLINIPVAVVYFWLTINSFSTIRITFTNSSETTLNDINILECRGLRANHIDKLEVGESKTIWVKGIQYCSIDMDYLSDGQRKGETIDLSICNTCLVARKVEYNIDAKYK